MRSAPQAVQGTARHGVRGWHLVVLAVLCALPLAHGTLLVSAPYGDSHDGRNGSIWAAGAEALRSDPIGSRLGAVREDESVYATHPPAILTTLAVAESVAGDRPSTDRSVIFAGTIAALVLTFALLLACRFTPVAALIGVAAMAASPMIRAYGTMVDTPMLAFPVACAVVLIVVRLDDRVRLRWWELVVFGAAPLVSWQLVLLEALVVGGLALDGRRRRHVAAVVVASAVGGALTGIWLLWANGGAGPVVDQWLIRSSVDSDVGLRTAIDTQWQAALHLLGPLMLLLPVAVVVGFQSVRRRWASALSVGVVILYSLLLIDGVAHHDYWAYWVLLPVAIGGAGAVELLGRLAVVRGYPHPVRVALIVAVVGGLLVPGLLSRRLIEDVNRSSAPVADVIASAELAPGQRILWALADFRLGDLWLEDLGFTIRHLTESQYQRLVALGRADDVVVISTSCTVEFLACDRIPFPREPYRHRHFALVTIGELVDRRPAAS